jgi:cyanophycinase-like exopeptidase
MPGPIALHGGGEFLPGDEGFLLACLEAARPAADARVTGAPGATHARPSGSSPLDGRSPLTRSSPADDPYAVRIAIVPAAAAGQRPELAARHGVEAFRGVARDAGIPVRAEAVMVVDAASASSATLAGHLTGADLVHLPGGDPGRLLAILDGSAAWHAIRAALARGAVVAGASAGAMVLADWTWTPSGWRRALGLVPGLVVVPHAERVARGGWAGTFGDRVPAEAEPIGRLGLEERTGVLRTTDDHGRSAWRVVGAGSAYWSAPGSATLLRAAAGEPLAPEPLPGGGGTPAAPDAPTP